MAVLDFDLSGRNSAVECQLPKLDVAGSTPVARSTNSSCRISGLRRSAASAADAGQINRTASLVQEDEIAAKLSACALLLQLVNNEREPVHLALARCGLREADSGEAMYAAANS